MKNTDYKRKNSKTVMEFTVTESSGLLEFLRLKLRGRSRNNIKSLLAHGEVSVDGHTVKQYDYPLSKEQTVQIFRSANRGEKQKEQLKILYEDQDLIVVDKPSGLLSVATDDERKKTAYHMLTDYVRRTDKKSRVFIIHRLDRDTSGVMMFAKNERIKRALQEQWDSLVSLRGYVAVVEGRLKEKSGRIHSWLKQTNTLLVYSSGKAKDGQEAVTHYQVIRESANYSLVNIQLETGRKNQIRVHMKDLGHLVAGDRKYGALSDPLKRLGLHAHKLEFKHPFSNKQMSFAAGIPHGFKTLTECRDTK